MIDAIGSIPLGPEFQVSGIETSGADAPAAQAESDASFGGVLKSSLDRLEGMLQDASDKSAALAAGTTNDLTGVVVSVERAQLGLQLAVQIRNKAVEAYQDIFRMQV
jgi:flagellar hook-basal body complex protein FliE